MRTAAPRPRATSEHICRFFEARIGRLEKAASRGTA